jgi:cell division protein FtsB
MKVFYTIVLFFIMMVNTQLLARQDGIRETFLWRDRLYALQDQVDDLALKNADIIKELSDLKQHTDSVEARARYELGMIKKGESYVQISHWDPNSLNGDSAE